MIKSIILFTGVVFLTYFYQGIVLPILIQRLKFRLYSSRDRLRWLKITGHDISDEVFKYIQNSINVSTKLVEIIDIGLIWRLYPSISGNKDLEREIEINNQLINGCAEKEIIQIMRETKRNNVIALLLNSFVLLCWAIPIVVVFILGVLCYEKARRLFNQLKNKVKVVVINFISTPEPEFIRVVSSFRSPIFFSK
jgi:hypothetical protein